jgi:hypothetical protein
LTMARARAAASAATAATAGLGGSMFAVGNTELGPPFFPEVDDLSRQVEAARVAIRGEALRRGAQRPHSRRASAASGERGARLFVL